MDAAHTTLPIGRQVSLPGHFDLPVTLESARPIGKGFECRVRLHDGSLDEAVISEQEAAALVGSTPDADDKTPLANADQLRLLVESARIRLAYAHDRQFAVSLSGIRTLPHQIEAVYIKMLPQPRLRFLLADDPGAGKTIMAGLLIKEMKLREAVERVLILCPSPLTIQWQDEMLRWFGESFDIIFSAVDQQQLTNPWQRSNQIIASIDYAKQDDVRERVWQQRWDLIIIDEAHKCSAYTKKSSSRGDEVEKTKRYQLAEHLTAQPAGHVLLLTATPHHGDDDRFAHFIRLLDPDLFPEPHRNPGKAGELRREILSLGPECPWALRRLKEDLKDLQGHRLFPDRHAHTITFRLNRDEYDLYKAVTAYINEFLPQASGRKKASVALARTVLQRRLASSTMAIFESIRRRLEKQQQLLEELENLTPPQRARRLAQLQGRLDDAEQDEDDLDEAERDQLADSLTDALELDQLRAEIAALQELIARARRVRDQGADSKLTALHECLTRAEFHELTDGRGKLLIFTEHRDTLNHLRQHLEKWGYTVTEIHGGMNPHERKRAQEDFRTTRQICVATEAAGEGINLQFCRLMINYDLPWNPTRLEQRLGRIHRIGQERDVHAFNFVASQSEEGQDIVEGRILARLLEKLEQMREVLADRVFDVVGEGSPPKLGVTTGEVVSGFFSFLGLTRLTSEKVIAKAIATGVEKRIFGYLGGGAPSLGTDGKYRVSASKVRFDTAIAPDEIDLDSGFILLPQSIPQPAAPLGPTPPGPTPPGPIPPGATPPGAPAPGPTPPAGAPQRSVELSFTADRDQLFTAWNAMANLAEMAGKVSVTVKAESADGFDKSKLNNGVLEPLREADLIQ